MTASTPSQPTSAERPTRVLVVEDSPTQAAELRLVLEAEGFEVVVAADGAKGLELVATSEPDVIVSDIVMPGRTGYDLCRAIRVDARKWRIPIILLTSLSDPKEVIQGLESGADSFLTKPCEPAQLVARIRTLLEGRRLRAERPPQTGVEVSFLGRTYVIRTGREQILDLLVSTYEDAVRANRQLREREADLAAAQVRIGEYVRQLEERVRTSEEHFRTLVESMDDAVMTLDPQLRLTGLFGGGLAEWLGAGGPRLGQSLRELLGDEAAVVHEGACARVLRGERVSCEWSLTVEGSPRHFHTSSSPLRSPSGEVTGLVSVSREITAQKKLQAQLMVSDRMASMGMIAAGVAHEINNPLTSVMANLDLLQRDLEQSIHNPRSREDLAEQLKDAREGAEKVRKIVGALRIFSRAEELDKVGPVDAESILESSIRMAWNEIRHRARLVRDYAPVAPVQASESQLGQLFLNLLINAAQALPEGRADANEIRVRIRPGGPDHAVVEVSDTGPGIPPEVLCHLFAPFVTTRPVGVGTGLGLAICHRIVKGLGGEIAIETRSGKGTTFRIALPLARAAVEPAAPPAPETRSSRRGRVLVVDDETAITSAVRRTLSRDHEVAVANSAREALEIVARSEPFDLVLCDVMMPEMNGMELYGELERRTPELAARVVFLTGGAFTKSARAFLERKPNAHMEKPFSLSALRALANERIR